MVNYFKGLSTGGTDLHNGPQPALWISSDTITINNQQITVILVLLVLPMLFKNEVSSLTL